MKETKKTEVSFPEAGGVPHPYLDDQSQKLLMNRLARIAGHVRSIQGMVEEHRCADEILLQVAAVKAALNQFSAAVLDHELKACMNYCMEGEMDERLDKVTRVLATLLKQS